MSTDIVIESTDSSPQSYQESLKIPETVPERVTEEYIPNYLNPACRPCHHFKNGHCPYGYKCKYNHLQSKKSKNVTIKTPIIHEKSRYTNTCYCGASLLSLPVAF